MSKESIVVRLKLEVDQETANILDGQSRICNWLYNYLLEKGLQLKREFIQSNDKEAAKTLYTKRGLRNLLPQIKEEHPFLKVVHSSPLKNTALRLSEAIRAHQKSKNRTRRGKQMGWPKFRAWKKNWFSILYDEPEKGLKIQALKKQPVLDEKGNPTGKEFYLPSKQWTKYDRTLKRALRKRREQTKTFIYTCAHRLFQDYDCVTIGDYTPSGQGINPKMRRAMNNRSLNGRFKQTLSWVARKSGKTFFEFDEKRTTRTCNHCLHIESQGIPLAIRQWQCVQCQTVHIRDENAAINGLRKVLRDLPAKIEGEIPSIVSGSDLALIQERWAWCVLPSGVVITPRGQNSEILAASRN